MDDQDKKATEIPAFLRRRPVGAGDGGTYVVGEQWYQSEIERLQRELAACIKRRRELDDESYEHAERAEKAERERDEAWAAIRSAPHSLNCSVHVCRLCGYRYEQNGHHWGCQGIKGIKPSECDCWKHAALGGEG